MKRRYNYWTKDETEQLRLLFPVLPNNQLDSRFVNKNSHEIYAKAMRMKLKRPKDFYDHSQPTITKTEKAYIAGLFDGEGSVFIWIGNRNKKPYHQLRIGLANTDKDIIDYLYKLFGGCVQMYSKQKIGCQKSYSWLMYSRKAMMFLELIEPYARIKKEQIRIAIEFQKKKKYSCLELTEEVILEREACRQKLKSLKGLHLRLKEPST